MRNYSTMFLSVLFCLITTQTTVLGSSVKMKNGYFDPQNPDKSLAFPDFLLPRVEYPIKPRVCIYKGKEYPDGTVVVTDESCLKCKCMGGSLICYLRVCPTLPDPPPSQCVLLLRRGACCSELVCEDNGLATNHISRAEPNALDHPHDTTISFGDGKGCIDNGTLYASGSAMTTSSLCEYCYCISGSQRCIKPNCLLPVPGCTPTRSPHSCCPVSYNCEHAKISTTTTKSPANRETGCLHGSVFYPDGERITSKESPCTNCFCIRGKVKCANLSCAPPLHGCTPIVEPGKCCASRYNCYKKKSHSPVKNILNQDNYINERSFPGDTLLTPSQIAEILLGSERRSTRNNESEHQKNEKNNSEIKVTIIRTPVEINKIDNTSATYINPMTTKKQSTVSTNESKLMEENITMKPKASTNNEEHESKNDNDETVDNENVEETSILSKESSKITDKIDVNSAIIDEDYTSVTTVIMNDSINCTTEISSGDESISTENLNAEESPDSLLIYDTQERTPIIHRTSIDADSLIDDNKDVIHENSSKTYNNRVSSRFPSHSLIIPKDDDVFMVNVSTFVRTNTSVVTLRPVAAIPPEIEEILKNNMKNDKEDYLDYDYKSSLPPSLPNLEIIPFLATDAVIKDKKTEKKKPNNKFDEIYQSPNAEKFSASIDNRYNETIYPIVTPAPYDSYLDEKYSSSYNRNPIYKQHINDKFKATTFSTNIEKYKNTAIAQDKFDDLPIIGSGTESPEFRKENKNLFSPPDETEGGFLPHNPSKDPYYNLGLSSTGGISLPGNKNPIDSADIVKTTEDNCISNGKEFKNKELITELHACVVCYCYYGVIHCQDPECPAIKPGCRRIIEKSSSSCCGIEICSDENLNIFDNSETHNLEIVTKSAMTTTETPVYKTTIATASQSTPLLSNDRPSEMPTSVPHFRSTLGKISTFVVPSKLNKFIATESPTSSSATLENVSTESMKTSTSSTVNDTKQSNNLLQEVTEESSALDILSNIFAQKNDISELGVTDNEISKVTTIDNDESDPFSEEVDDNEDGEEFNFDSVLKYLLGEDTPTKPPKTTSKIDVTPSTITTKLNSISSSRASLPHSTVSTTKLTSISPFSTTQQTKPKVTSEKPKQSTSSVATFKIIPSTTSPIASSSTSTTTSYKNSVHKNIFSKPTSFSTFAPTYVTKPRFTTKLPATYSTPFRHLKPKYSPTNFPFATEIPNRIVPPYHPRDPYQGAYLKKPSPSDSTLPFSVGLKLAGCNIYGRMYRVGKIISELSGPCLQCMCTDVGVQCQNLYMLNC